MACILALLATQAQAGPRTTVIDPLSPAERRVFDPDKLTTVPTWSRPFSIEGQDYHYRIVGSRPRRGGTVAVPTVIVPIRLEVPDQSAVFDATPIVAHILSSPLFAHGNGHRQFADAMLHAEFPKAPRGWHTLLDAATGPTLDIVMPAGSVNITQSQSGKLFGFINNSKVVNDAIRDFAHANPAPDKIYVFITYNSVESFAFGYHSWFWGDGTHTSALVYMYSSWMEDIDDVLGFPSPDAATLSHEVVETVHDPLITSVTREWGDPFRNNKCFDTLIEVADAIEDAPLHKVYAKLPGTLGGEPFLFTVQNAALLPWFTRESPSSARGGAYSFPKAGVLDAPAPLDCVKR